ncbi:hypothetical protein BJ165DRAFT_1597859 [Panaeolus papilionaceus]|nr:hypothetical protein BJ165DRAFT_1597859 [Panaeolus papilionaceus]
MEAIQRHQTSLQLLESIQSNEPLFTVPRSRGHDHYVVRENDAGNVRAPLGRISVYEILSNFVNKEPEAGDRPMDNGTEGDKIKIFEAPHPSPANTTPDKIIDIPITERHRTAEVVCVLEFKKPSLSGKITRIIAVEEGWRLERDWAKEACLVTSIYGFQYLATWDSISRELLWSKNMAGPRLRQAANVDAARLDEATIDNIFDFFFNGILQGAFELLLENPPENSNISKSQFYVFWNEWLSLGSFPLLDLVA